MNQIDKIHYDVLPQIRKTGSYGVATTTQNKLSEEQNFQEAVKFIDCLEYAL